MYIGVHRAAAKEEGAEQRRCKLLSSALEEEFLVWFPMKEVKEKRAGKYESVDKPMFSGYLFMYWEGSDERRFPIFEMKRLPTVINILDYDDGSHALKGKDLEFARWLHMHGGYIKQSKVIYREGQRIHICDGPLKGFDGNVVKVDKHHKRIVLRFDIGGNVTDVSFSVDFLDSNNAVNAKPEPTS